LAGPAEDPLAATRSMLALHSSDPVTVYLSSWARVRGFRVGDLMRILYENRSLLRVYGMRRTLWLVDRPTVPLVHHSSTRAIGDKEWRRLVRIIEEGGVADDGVAWLEDVLPRVMAVIRDHGEILTRDLTREVPELAAKISYHNRAGRHVGTFGMSTRTMSLLALQSRVIRTRPAGSWISSQYRWAEMESWLGGPIEQVSSDRASAHLVALWLRVFGPGTETDLRWWTGWPLRQVRAALESVSAVEVETSGGVGYLLPDDMDPVDTPPPWVAVLPSLDPTPMGWKHRDWYLGDHSAQLFDRSGNAGPTVWVDGRIVGGWAQRKDGEMVYELLEDVGRDAYVAIGQRLGELGEWMDGVIATPRFRSPLHQKLTT
jgi:hypothetical protein